MLKKCTGAVSCRAPCERSEWRGYNLSRCQKFVMVQNYYCVQLRVSGCRVYYKSW